MTNNSYNMSRKPFDNGRLRMENYRGVLYCEAYLTDEFGDSDVQTIIDYINHNFGGFTDIILKKSGNYSVSIDAQMRLTKGVKEFRNFVYIVDSEIKRESARYAASTYMSAYQTSVCNSREDAYSHLVELSLEEQK